MAVARQGETGVIGYNPPYRAPEKWRYPTRKGADFRSRWYSNRSWKDRMVKVLNGAKLNDWQLIDWKDVNQDVQNLRQRIFVASKNRGVLLERECYESRTLRSEGRLATAR